MILRLLAQVSPGAPAQPELPPIRDIAPPVDVFPWPIWMVWCAVLAGLIVLGAMACAIAWYLRRRPQAPPPTPRAVALRELERLRGAISKVPPYEFSFAVSDVLRTYIGAEYRLHAREQTSPEFLAAIASAERFGSEDRELLGRFLERCDLIKFAHIDASEEDSSELLGSAIRFVQGERA